MIHALSERPFFERVLSVRGASENSNGTSVEVSDVSPRAKIGTNPRPTRSTSVKTAQRSSPASEAVQTRKGAKAITAQRNSAHAVPLSGSEI